MSLKTRIRGYTSWVNLRLKPYGQLMSNVLMDLLTGTNLKLLLHSMTGRQVKRLDTFDGLTQQQKVTRVEWVLDELKKSKVIPDDVFVDVRMFAMRSADHIFILLWRLVCHDIWFIWERAEFLQHDSNEVLTEVPFKWIPDPPPIKKKKTKTKKSLLSGFGASSLITEKIDEDDEVVDGYDPYPRSEYMKKFKHRQKDAKYPPPNDCIMDMVNRQLKTLHEGRKLHVTSVDELVDSRVLCALLNSFIPNLFTTEVLLNDRWSINLVLRTLEKLFYIESPFDSEDLVEGDTTSLCAYFCTFFMLAYKYRQSKAVCNYVVQLKQVSKEKKAELDKFPPVMSSREELSMRKDLKTDLDNIKTVLERIERKFDIEFCFKWIEHVEETTRETHKMIRKKIKERFDTISVPRNISINDMCLAAGINLSLTNGSGFYKLEHREGVGDGRRLVLKDTSILDWIDDFTGAKARPDSTRKLLQLPEKQTVDIYPDKNTKYEIYVESNSRNKQLHPGSVFLYQVFPGNMATWQKIFLKAIKENEFETVHRMLIFFRTLPAFINGREPGTGNTALHWACRLGHYDMVEYLLENSANIDLKNNAKQSALFSACEGQHQQIGHLLIEWGCDVHIKGPRGQTAFETVRNDEFRDFLIAAYEHYSTCVPRIMEGNVDLLQSLVHEHTSGTREFNNLRSRCINGSTLLHTAAYFGCIPVMLELLGLGVDVNLLDYKGATALHRARDVHTIKVLMEAGASHSIEDSEGNTALHVKCYGETGKGSEMDAIESLLQRGAKLTIRNTRELLPIHCSAMQGRIDVIKLLLTVDQEKTMLRALGEEKGKKPPSVVHLALANDCIQCAAWLLQTGFEFKEGEQDLLVQRILSEQIQLASRSDALKFLLDHGANPNPRYPGGNTALHYASSMSGDTDVLETLVMYGAHLDAANEDGATPLFFACQCNNQFAASILISQGSNLRIKNLHGLTAFDFIMDYEEWIDCGYFTDEIRARLKAYSLKHARDLIRAISKKVKAPVLSQQYWPSMSQGPTSHGHRSHSHHHTVSALSYTTEMSSSQSPMLSLPPLRQQTANTF